MLIENKIQKDITESFVSVSIIIQETPERLALSFTCTEDFRELLMRIINGPFG